MSAPESPEAGALAARHQRFGWWALLGFLSLGLLLEAFHAFKLGWYLDVSNETRRLMFNLSHVHGTLFAVVNLCFGFALQIGSLPRNPLIELASKTLIAGSLLMPLGFLLGGITVYGGDPGLPVFLAPAGGILMAYSVGLVALTVHRR